MVILTQIAQFVLIISILVVLHELGHFIPAKLFKTRVEKFYLFFDPWFSLVKKKFGGTEYGIGWLPMGGYVKIAGMIDESMDKEQMEQPEQPWEFRSKKTWQRLIIMLGGVIVNVLLAWFIYTVLLATKGDTYIPTENITQGVSVNERGEKLGFKTGDKILNVDGKEIKKYSDLFLEIILADEVLVDRNGEQKQITITDEGLAEVFTGLKDPFILPRIEAYVGEVPDSLNAYKAGLKTGDKILKINDTPVLLWEDIGKTLENIKNETVALTIKRDDKTIQKEVLVDADGKLGISFGTDYLQKTDEYSLLEAIPAGFTKTFKVLNKQVRQFKVIFKPKTQAYKQVKGPIGIVEQMPESWDWNFFWNFTAMFSIWLAFVNLLPIPALDGGHVMFLLYEMISGRKPSQKVLENGQLIGFIIVMGIMVLVFGNDIWNIIKRFL